MKDSKSIAKIALLHPQVRVLFQRFIEDAEIGLDITIRIVQGLRTFEEQQAIYDQGRAKPGKIVSWAKAGQSYHNYGIAVDICPLINNGAKLDWNYDFEKLVPFAEKYGITWGGDFPKPDNDHFENKLGFNWRELLKRYNESKFIPGTKYVSLEKSNSL